jgi:hypothetical protein
MDFLETSISPPQLSNVTFQAAPTPLMQGAHDHLEFITNSSGT